MSKTMDEKLDLILNTMTDMNKRLINVEQDMAEVKQDIAEVKQDMAGVKQEQKSIVSELGRMGKKLDSIEYRVTGLEDRVGGLESQVSENTKILRVLEDNSKTYKAEHDQISNKLDHIQGDITSLKKDSEKGEEAYNIVQGFRKAFSK